VPAMATSRSSSEEGSPHKTRTVAPGGHPSEITDVGSDEEGEHQANFGDTGIHLPVNSELETECPRSPPVEPSSRPPVMDEQRQEVTREEHMDTDAAPHMTRSEKAKRSALKFCNGTTELDAKWQTSVDEWYERCTRCW
jgi:hypothetical protein